MTGVSSATVLVTTCNSEVPPWDLACKWEGVLRPSSGLLWNALISNTYFPALKTSINLYGFVLGWSGCVIVRHCSIIRRDSSCSLNQNSNPPFLRNALIWYEIMCYGLEFTMICVQLRVCWDYGVATRPRELNQRLAGVSLLLECSFKGFLYGRLKSVPDMHPQFDPPVTRIVDDSKNRFYTKSPCREWNSLKLLMAFLRRTSTVTMPGRGPNWVVVQRIQKPCTSWLWRSQEVKVLVLQTRRGIVFLINFPLEELGLILPCTEMWMCYSRLHSIISINSWCDSPWYSLAHFLSKRSNLKAVDAYNHFKAWCSALLGVSGKEEN